MTPHKFRSFYGKNPDRQTSGQYITFPITLFKTNALSSLNSRALAKGLLECSHSRDHQMEALHILFWMIRWEFTENGYFPKHSALHHADADWCWQSKWRMRGGFTWRIRWCWQSNDVRRCWWRMREWFTWRIQRLTSKEVQKPGQQLTSSDKT